MNVSWLRPALLKGRHWAVKNAPHILMALGTGSGITAVIFAVKATPKAAQAKKDAEFAKNDDREDDEAFATGIFKSDMAPLTPVETVKACGKYYIPAVGMELFSLMCFWGAHGINVKRQALLAGTVYSMEQMLIEYQKKVVEMIGDKPEREIRNAVAQEHIDKDPPPNVLFETDTDVWCYYKGYKFRGNYLRLKEIQNEANAEMIRNMYLSESDLLWLFDPDRRWIVPSDDSRLLGWGLDSLLEFDILPCMDPNHRPALTVEIRDKDGHEYLPKPGFAASL